MDLKLPHGLSLDPTAPAFPFGYGLDYLDVAFTNATVRSVRLASVAARL